MVPTTNFILKWNQRDGRARYDENLAEVSLITKDAFEPSLPLSVVVHIDYRKAPLVIQRFGDIKRLVEQTLDPMVAAYFKNIGQTRTLIQLLQDRSEIQKIASEEMKAKFAHYNLELEEVLIGTPTSARPGADRRDPRPASLAPDRGGAGRDVCAPAEGGVKERELREAESRASSRPSPSPSCTSPPRSTGSVSPRRVNAGGGSRPASRGRCVTPTVGAPSSRPRWRARPARRGAPGRWRPPAARCRRAAR